MKARGSVKESIPLPQMVFSVEKMGGGTHSSIIGIQGIPRWTTPKFSDEWKQKNYIKRNIHLLEAIFFSAFSSSFFQIISFVPKVPPHAIQGPITEGSWRSPEHSLLLPNCNPPAAPPLDVLVRWEMTSAAGHGASSRVNLVSLCQQFNISSSLSSMEHWTYIQALC